MVRLASSDLCQGFGIAKLLVKFIALLLGAGILPVGAVRVSKGTLLALFELFQEFLLGVEICEQALGFL